MMFRHAVMKGTAAISPASCQQHLSVHLDGRPSPELSSRQVSVMRGVDVVVRHGLVHLHVDVQPVQEHGRVLVRHQVPDQAVLTQQPYSN
ncbi:hypothetical protein CEXT_632381 [Caerostris extrusa]|uniref:Uncharacterized protein n=1 Tax=Caerostris extrusa TaxID=172846 RepID=A0AAV4Y308_CAEEX|nr:hypothetical protein CEXT_632381 [Caerostris extrusa]